MPAPPLAWYYLNAALDYRHNRAGKGAEWLAQAEPRYVVGSGQTYAESFDRLGWGTGRSGPGVSPDAWRDAHSVAIAETVVGENAGPRTHDRLPTRPSIPRPDARVGGDTECRPGPLRSHSANRRRTRLSDRTTIPPRSPSRPREPPKPFLRRTCRPSSRMKW